MVAIEQQIRGVFGPKLSLEVLVLGDVELSDFDVVEEGPTVGVDPTVVLVVSCVNVRPFVCDESD